MEPAYLYSAQVGHRRLVAPLYTFSYRVFYLLLDIDRLAEADALSRLFSYNRLNVLSFFDADHGSEQSGALRSWAENLMKKAGIKPDGGRIRLFCMPRLFGYAFNPISIWYCEGRDGQLRAVIAEVRNTFKEKHSYLLASGGGTKPYEQTLEKEKCFHVSPFLDLKGRYRFLLGEPGENLKIQIHEMREGTPILDASVAGQRLELTTRTVAWQVLKMPFMTLKVVVGIHWEALKIWLRGAKYHSKPEPPSHEVS